MPVPLLKNVCGVLELKTGCFIIGYFSVVGCLIATVQPIISMATGIVYLTEESSPWINEFGIVTTVIAGSGLILILLALASSVVLIMGLHGNKSNYLKSYLVYLLFFNVMIIFKIIASIICIPLIASQLPKSHVKNVVEGMATIVIGIIQDIVTIVVGSYFFVVGRSLYIQMIHPCPPNGSDLRV